MATFFRKKEEPKPLPDVYYDKNNTAYTNLYSLSIETLNELGFYIGPDAPVLSDLFHFNCFWDIDKEEWAIYEREYQERLNIFKSKIKDYVVEWRKVNQTFELQIITLDYTSELELEELKSSILWVRNKITSLEAITYRNWQEEGVEGFGSDEEYNPEAFAFLDNEPIPAYSRVGE